jgi:hypothetical protein
MTLKLRPTGLGSGSTRTALITPSAAVLQAKTLGSPHAYPTASSQGMTAPPRFKDVPGPFPFGTNNRTAD